MQETPNILRTNDYSLFKSVNFNRDKNNKHISTVKKMLLKENLLHLHPILVNEKMEVIDGQHRLAAAQELGLEVFYIKSDVSYDHILNSNSIQKNLKLDDVIKFYAVRDKIEDYVRLREFIQKLGINPKAFIGLIFGSCLPPLIECIKEGKFRFPKEMVKIDFLFNCYSRFLNFCNERKIKPISMFKSHIFTIGFRNIVSTIQFNEKIFFSKLEMRWFDLKPQLNSKEWTRQIAEIYNWKNQNPLGLHND